MSLGAVKRVQDSTSLQDKLKMVSFYGSSQKVYILKDIGILACVGLNLFCA